MYATKKKKVVEQQAQLLSHLRNKVDELESKLARQTQYLTTLHGHVSKILQK